MATFLADDRQAQMVESRNDQPARVLAFQQLVHAVLHLARGLVGEGQRSDVVRLITTLVDEVGDLARDHAGLAAAGTSQHQQRTIEIAHGAVLAGVEGFHARGSNEAAHDSCIGGGVAM